MKNRKGKKWTKSELARLKKLAKKGEDTKSIAKKFNCTPNAIYLIASRKNFTLKPKDK